MPAAKTSANGKKNKKPLLLHRKSNQFKSFVQLLRESHARVQSKRDEVQEAVQA